MTVLLVLLTFAGVILIDWLLTRKRPVAVEAASELQRALALDPDYVEGFLVPARFRYHPGHSWVYKERPRVARVGVDEFAARLLGKIDRVELPRPGTWLRQGQKAFAFYKDGEKTEVLSPTEGEVVEVNERVLRDPSLLARDPYGEGWLLAVHVPDEETVTRNLVPPHFVRSWMRDEVERLYSFQPRVAGAVAADGGRPVEDLLADLPHANWREITAEFFLTK